ncbi:MULTISPECIES: hypothetical protein [Bacteroidota]|uniref:hypothetical protein n=1 Tax=Bacteroidota TaxID=976 RepID=UPI0024202A86|nr:MULTISPECIES: hypothetical protein [Bacteroidota]
MKENEIRSYKDRIRIFFILYFFSEPFTSDERPHTVRLFKTETRIQKIDFLFRNPDYLAYELLLIAKNDKNKSAKIKDIVKEILQNNEPTLKRLEMERFFYGAYEDIDDIIGFLSGIGFIEFDSRKSSDFKTIDKQYYILKAAEDKMAIGISEMKFIQWYKERCLLIAEYFGDLSGTQLKVNQYRVDEYRDTSYREYIGSIEETVRKEYSQLYHEKI